MFIPLVWPEPGGAACEGYTRESMPLLPLPPHPIQGEAESGAREA